MKKVFMINDFESGGGAEVIFNQTLEILNSEYEIKSYTGSLKHKFHKNPFSYIYNPYYKKEIFKAITTFKPEIIHLHNFYHVLSPSILISIKKYKRNHKKVKIIYTAHDFHLCFPNSGYYFFTKNKLKKIQHPLWSNFFKKLDHRGWIYSTIKLIQWVLAYKILNLHLVIDTIISPSIFLKNTLSQAFQNNKNIFLIRNPFNSDKPQNSAIKNRDSTLKLVYVGRVSFEKGIIEFINALINYNRDYTFDIYGTGDLDYILKIKKLIINTNIKLHGFKEREEILNCLDNYDALVLPSLWYENFPTVMLEASFKRIKILTCNYGGMRELGQIIGNTYFFDIYNKLSILESLNKCHSQNYSAESFNEVFFNSISNQSYKQEIMKAYEA